MQKWEYCVITGLGSDTLKGFDTKYPKLMIFTAKGAELKTNFQQRQSGVDEQDMVAITIASLGTNGWELVGAGTTATGTTFRHSLYFKRPIQP